MSKKLYVENLSRDTTSNDLHELFSTVGTVVSVSILKRGQTGVVEMETHETAAAAIKTMNGYRLHERELKIEAIRLAEELGSDAMADQPG